MKRADVQVGMAVAKNSGRYAVQLGHIVEQLPALDYVAFKFYSDYGWTQIRSVNIRTLSPTNDEETEKLKKLVKDGLKREAADKRSRDAELEMKEALKVARIKPASIQRPSVYPAVYQGGVDRIWNPTNMKTARRKVTVTLSAAELDKLVRFSAWALDARASKK